MFKPTPPASIWLTSTQGSRDALNVWTSRWRSTGVTAPVIVPTTRSASTRCTASKTSLKNEKTTTFRSFTNASSTMSQRRASLAEPATVPGM
jgi:hypothetical protein